MSQNAWSRLSIRLTLALALIFLFNLTLTAWGHPPLARAADQPQLLVVNGSNLVLVNADGTGQTTLYSQLKNYSSAVWSPDGSKVAIVGGDSLAVIQADGSGYKTLTTSVQGAAWSPDSSSLVYWNEGTKDKPMAVSKINPDGSSNQKLFEVQTDFYVRTFGFLPDGKKLLYGEDQEFGPGATSSLIVCNLDGSGKTKIADGINFPVSIKVSPDGKQILFDNVFESFVASASDPIGTIKKLGLVGATTGIDWSTNPNQVISVSLDKVEEVDLATKNSRTIANIDPALIPFAGEAPSISPVTVTPAGFVAFTNFSTNSSKDSYVVNINNGQVRDIGKVKVMGWRPSASSTAPTTYGKILPDFFNVWKQSDLPIAQGQSKRSWLWGPDAFATKTEDYKEAKGGQRQVQYFDKARMEINNPDGDRSNLYFVTNGLLPKELITGQMQVGDSSFITKSPADINVAGDPGGSVTYAKLAGVTTLAPGQNVTTDRTGQSVTASIDRTGAVSQRQALPDVQLTQYVKETQHNLPNVFVDYFKTLPQDWVFVMGYPLSEPYLTDITLNGKPTQALVQVFERRVLTYTPSNADPYKVEQGNVGQHYYKWRYGG